MKGTTARPGALLAVVAVGFAAASCGGGSAHVISTVPARPEVPHSSVSTSEASLRSAFLTAQLPVTREAKAFLSGAFSGHHSSASVRRTAVTFVRSLANLDSRLTALEARAPRGLVAKFATARNDDGKLRGTLEVLLAGIGHPSFDASSWASTFLTTFEDAVGDENALRTALGLPSLPTAP
jgi:hypothetical protein